MKRFGIILSLLLVAAGTLAVPSASANYAPCDVDRDGWTNPAESIACLAVGIVLHVTLETVQCALTGESDICLIP